MDLGMLQDSVTSLDNFFRYAQKLSELLDPGFSVVLASLRATLENPFESCPAATKP